MTTPIITERPATYMHNGTALTPNEGCDIYGIVAERPADLVRLHRFVFFTDEPDGYAEWEAGIVLAEDGTGRAVTWRKKIESEPAPSPAYGITFNTTTKHYLRSDDHRRTLCGARSAFPLQESDAQSKSILAGRPLCVRCSQSAPKRGYLTADRIDWSDPDRKLKVQA